MKQKPENLKEVIDMAEDCLVYYINERPQRKLGGKPPSLYKKTNEYGLKKRDCIRLYFVHPFGSTSNYNEPINLDIKIGKNKLY